MNSAPGLASRSAMSSNALRLSHWSGTLASAAVTGARALSGNRASAMAFSGALRRSITPMAAPSLRRHSRDSSSSANSACERRCASCAALVMCAPAASSSRPLASRTPKGSVASWRRWSGEKGISFKQ